MANEAVSMVVDSICAYMPGVCKLARSVIRSDDRVDALFEVIKEELVKREIPRGGIPAQTALMFL